MEIQKVVSEEWGMNCYIISENNHCFIIDPVYNKTTCEIIDNMTIDFVILTHEHYDHIWGINSFKKNVNCRIFCSEEAFSAIQDAKKNLSKYLFYLADMHAFGDKREAKSVNEYQEITCEATDKLKDGQVISWENHTLLAKNTPGHSPGSICLLIDNKYLFSGDTIFKKFETQLRFPGGNKEDYHDITIPWIESLEQEIIVFPGHTDAFILKNRFR